MIGDAAQVRWLLAQNNHTSAIPSHGAVEVVGASIDADTGRVILAVTVPAGDSVQPIAVNSWQPIPVDGHGLVTFDGPIMVLYNTANTPTTGEEWGAESGVFTIGKEKSGFITLGATSVAKTIVLADFSASSHAGGYKPYIDFTLTASLAVTDSSKSATIRYQYGSGIANPDTTITVHNIETHTGGTYVYSGDNGDRGRAVHGAGQDYYIVEIECP